MPIYEYYCPDNHTLYQFYAKTLAQGKRVPRCPDNPKFQMKKVVSAFAVSTGSKKESGEIDAAAQHRGDAADEARIEAAMGAMEKEFAGVDDNDPKAMAHMMRKMSEATGEKIDGQMEEVVRKLEEGADPDTIEEELGGEAPCQMPDPYEDVGAGAKGKAAKEILRSSQTPQPLRRDPTLYDYE